MKGRNFGTGSGGAFNWFFQRITGAVLLITLLVHFWVLHFAPSADSEITFQTVMARLNHPLWRTFDLLFLVFGLYHGMNGCILVLNDYVQKRNVRLAIVSLLWVGVIFLLIMGSMTILSLPSQPAC